MNISSISSSTGTSTSYSAVNNDDEITQLEKEKANLQKELQKENQSKEDSKTKEQKVKQLQQQIQLIDSQIQQKKAEKTKKASENNAAVKNKEETEDPSSLGDMQKGISSGKIDILV